MNIFNKQPKFFAAKCPNCGGRLELDSDFEVAYCADCGSQCIIKNAKKAKKGPLDKVLNFVERQQSIQRQDAQEKEREKTEENKRKRELKEIRRKERKELIRVIQHYLYIKKFLWKKLLFIKLWLIPTKTN